jgi:hypothetical protein
MAAPASPPTGIDASFPCIQYNSINLWLPRKFTKWDCNVTRDAKVTRGNTYIQVATLPVRYEVTAQIKAFTDVSAAWVEGAGAQLFSTAWDAFQAWAGVGKVFEFYRKSTDTGSHSHFTYCVWTGKDDGRNLLIGHPRYSLDVTFATEGAAR